MVQTDLDFILLAMRYTLLEHDTLDAAIPRCAEKGVGLVIGGVFNSGITATGAVTGLLQLRTASARHHAEGEQDRGRMPASRR